MGSPNWQDAADIIGAGDDGRPPPPGPAARQRWLPSGLAFTLGVLVGAAGWERWRDFADERARRSAVAVVAELGAVFGPAANEGTQTISVIARLGNRGPLPVDVLGMELDLPGLVTPPGATASTVTLAPGATASVRFARILRCEELAVVGDEPLVVRVRTANGGVHDRRFVLTDDVLRIGELGRSQCERRDQQAGSAAERGRRRARPYA
jgi:hypothetical protein